MDKSGQSPKITHLNHIVGSFTPLTCISVYYYSEDISIPEKSGTLTSYIILVIHIHIHMSYSDVTRKCTLYRKRTFFGSISRNGTVLPLGLSVCMVTTPSSKSQMNIFVLLCFIDYPAIDW